MSTRRTDSSSSYFDLLQNTQRSWTTTHPSWNKSSTDGSSSSINPHREWKMYR